MRHICYGALKAVKPFFFWRLKGFELVSRRLVNCCGAALMAASEVERSGTRALSGFMRAERDTLRRGELAVAGCSLDLLGGAERV
jgi:hypothetical protein